MGKSLLVKAREYFTRPNRGTNITSEDIEVAIALVKGEITLTQINRAYCGETTKKPINWLYPKMLRCIIKGVKTGKIKIT